MNKTVKKISLSIVLLLFVLLCAFVLHLWQPWKPIKPISLQSELSPKLLEDLSDEERIKMESPLLMPPLTKTVYYPQELANFNPESLSKNQAQQTVKHSVSAFSFDTHTTSYRSLRQSISHGMMPMAEFIHIEEMLNYFDYQYPPALNKHPFAISTEIAPAPWNKNNLLLKIGLKAVDKNTANLPPTNLVVLVDVSGSMDTPQKLPLLKLGLKRLVQQLRPQDKLALMSYAKDVKLIVPSTPASQQNTFFAAIDSLQAGGRSNGGNALYMAYQEAQKNWQANGINRIVLATDGKFNLGLSADELKQIISIKRKTGVQLSMIGLQLNTEEELTLEDMAELGGGNYTNVDSEQEMPRVWHNELTHSLKTVADDVQIKLEFNPQKISQWRLIGYQNRVLTHEDSHKIQVGAGKSIIALYELTPAKPQDVYLDSRYQQVVAKKSAHSHELAFVKVMYQQPNTQHTQELSFTLDGNIKQHLKQTSSDDFRFAAAVAAFGQIIKQNNAVNGYQYQEVIKLAQTALANDPQGKRQEFVALVQLAENLNKGNKP